MRKVILMVLALLALNAALCMGALLALCQMLAIPMSARLVCLCIGLSISERIADAITSTLGRRWRK